MNNIKTHNNYYSSLFRLQDISLNNITENEKYDIDNLYLNEFKLFFKKYIENQKKRKNNINGTSDSDSTIENFTDIYNELNNLYLKSFKNLNNYLKQNNNLKGIRLEGNRLS